MAARSVRCWTAVSSKNQCWRLTGVAIAVMCHEYALRTKAIGMHRHCADSRSNQRLARVRCEVPRFDIPSFRFSAILADGSRGRAREGRIAADRARLVEGELTKSIIGAFYDTYNQLDYG